MFNQEVDKFLRLFGRVLNLYTKLNTHNLCVHVMTVLNVMYRDAIYATMYSGYRVPHILCGLLESMKFVTKLSAICNRGQKAYIYVS